MRRVLRRIRYLLFRRRFESELAEEMAVHRDMAERDLAAGGTHPAEAAAAARRAFGSSLLARDQARDVWVPRPLQGLGHDCRMAVRMLWKTRLVSAIAILSLALGIGANTALFSLVNSVLVRALPARDPGRLVLLVYPEPFEGLPYRISYGIWNQFRERPALTDGAAVWATDSLRVTERDRTEIVDTLVASGSFFDVLGVPAIAGRMFSDADDASVQGHADAEAVAVLSYRFWQRRFGGDSDVIGRPIVIEHVAFTIVGVAPRDFLCPEPGRTFDVAVTLGTEPRLHPRDSWLGESNPRAPLMLILRLRRDQTPLGVTATLRGIQPHVRTATMPPGWPGHQYLETPFTVASLSDAQWNVRRRFERPLMTMLIVVMMVLLVACGNLASLVLARARARTVELRTRWALGASRWRLVRQLLIESVLIAGVGGLIGVALASWASPRLVEQISTAANPIVLDLSPDRHVLLFTIIVTVVTVLVFGAMPAWSAAPTVNATGFKADDWKSTRGAQDRLAGGLVIGQVALSLALAVAAGLLGRTFTALTSRGVGFDPHRAIVATVSLRYANVDPMERGARYQRLLDAVTALPGVENAALSLRTPIVTGPMLAMPIEGVSGGPPIAGPVALAALNVVSPGWFDTFGILVLAGRDVSEHDLAASPPVGIVNQAFARRFLNGANPVGHTVRLDMPGPPRGPIEIVGLVTDTVYGTLRSPVPPTIYQPLAQLGELAVPFLTSADITAHVGRSSRQELVERIGSAIAAADPEASFGVHTLDELISESLTQDRVLAIVAASVGGLALLLAALGLYGVVAYRVACRRRELGIRLALGATAVQITRLVLGRIAFLVAMGLVAGALLSVWASQLIVGLLYDVEPRDPATLAGAALKLAAVAALATWLPTRRAVRIDPALTLRCE